MTVKRAMIGLVCLLLAMMACTPLGGTSQGDRPPVSGGFLRANCPTSLDADTLDQLALGMERTVEMQPGESRDFELGVVECCYFFEPVDTCVAWSVEPTAGAEIDPDSGHLTLDADVPNGSAYRVSADVENGRRVVSAEVHVFTPADNPLVGLWSEETQFACGTGQEVAPQQPIGELRFKADGTFGVTWMPFEIYVDYWGSYTYDLEQGTLQLTVSDGNYVPEDADLDGSLSFDEQGRMVLTDLWLGTPPGGTASANCGQRFTRG